jgi:peptide chain release factor subunit 1
MARTVSWDELRALAGFEAHHGCAISLYVNLDPAIAPTAGDVATRINALLDQAEKSEAAARTDLTHDQRLSIRSDIERIRRYYNEEFDRDGARGVAVFAAGLDNLWRALPVTETVPDDVKVGAELYLAPLVPLVGRGEGALVVAIGRERGDIYRLRGGRLEEVADLTDEQPGRHDQGGWSQARYQRRIDNLALGHLREVAEQLEQLVRRLHGCAVVVVASDETWAEFSEILSPEARSAIVGYTSAEAHAGEARLLELVGPVLESWRAEREREIVDRWREAAARNGRAAAGWERTLEAASDARVHVLLFQEGVDRPAWRCPACGRLAASAGKCPLDGTTLEPRSEGLDLVVRQTLVHGGSAWAVRHVHDLEPVEGIGALLRF